MIQGHGNPGFLVFPTWGHREEVLFRGPVHNRTGLPMERVFFIPLVFPEEL